jgi:hypothetical protein
MTLAAVDQQELIDQALAQLRAVLGEGWDVAPIPRSRFPDLRIDAVWAVRSQGDSSYGEITVEAKASLPPAVAAELMARQLDSLRELAGQAALVVAPWLSPRTREVLEERGLGYLDLTGNILLKLDRPAIFIKTQGADQNPVPQTRGRRGLSGPRAGLLVRELVDFHGPRRASELATATGLSEGYVSRLLDSMSDEALIRRSKDRLITKVDWRGLLRARAASYQLLKANHVAPALVRQGRGRLLDELREGAGRLPVLATGSLAAQAFAPTAVGGALMLYVPRGPNVITGVAKELGLLRIDQSADADVLLLQPMSEGALVRPHPELIDGIACVGLSQLVLDCLSGPGRMPAEGEAVLTWMSEHEDSWRRPSPLEATDGALR